MITPGINMIYASVIIRKGRFGTLHSLSIVVVVFFMKVTFSFDK